MCGFLFCVILYDTSQGSLDGTIVVLTKLFCWMQILSSFLWKYSLGLFLISECYVSGCCFSLFGFILSAAKILRHKTHQSRSSLLIITLVKLKDKYDSLYLHDFGFNIQLWLLFAVGLSSGFLCIPVKNLCTILCIRKHHLLVLDTGL
jgi:hypothetical protein